MNLFWSLNICAGCSGAHNLKDWGGSPEPTPWRPAWASCWHPSQVNICVKNKDRKKNKNK
jgi:hypothetical protein